MESTVEGGVQMHTRLVCNRLHLKLHAPLRRRCAACHTSVPAMHIGSSVASLAIELVQDCTRVGLNLYSSRAIERAASVRCNSKRVHNEPCMVAKRRMYS